MQFKLFSIFAVLVTSQAVQASPAEVRENVADVAATFNHLRDITSNNNNVWSRLTLTDYPQKYPIAHDGLKKSAALAAVTIQLSASVDGAKFINTHRVAVCDSVYSYTNAQIELLKTISSRRDLLRVFGKEAEIRVALRNIGDLIDHLSVSVLIPAHCDDQVKSRVQILAKAFNEAQE